MGVFSLGKLIIQTFARINPAVISEGITYLTDENIDVKVKSVVILILTLTSTIVAGSRNDSQVIIMKNVLGR